MSDPIMTEFMRLSLMHSIEDLHDYGHKWQRLAYECDKEGRVATAETCRKNAAHYWGMDGGEYIKLVETSFSELIRVGDCSENAILNAGAEFTTEEI